MILTKSSCFFFIWYLCVRWHDSSSALSHRCREQDVSPVTESNYYGTVAMEYILYMLCNISNKNKVDYIEDTAHWLFQFFFLKLPPSVYLQSNVVVRFRTRANWCALFLFFDVESQQHCYHVWIITVTVYVILSSLSPSANTFSLKNSMSYWDLCTRGSVSENH